MLERIIVMLLICAAMFAHDVPKLLQSGYRERMMYGLLIAVFLYLGSSFVMMKPWPNLDELVHYLLEKPAKLIVESVKAAK